MKLLTFSILMAAAVTLVVILSAPALVIADQGGKSLKADLEGFLEVPAVSSTGTGEFDAKISQDESSIVYRLSYEGLEGTAAAAHIHLGQRDVNGGIIAFLCGGGGKPPCPPAGTVTGTITAADVIGPANQGIAPGEFQEVLEAIGEDVTYVNVHTNKHPGGEIRGQVKSRRR